MSMSFKRQCLMTGNHLKGHFISNMFECEQNLFKNKKNSHGQYLRSRLLKVFKKKQY